MIGRKADVHACQLLALAAAGIAVARFTNLWQPTAQSASMLGCVCAFSMYWLSQGRSCTALQRRTSLKGKVAIVTGANSGIGFYTALQLAEMGCKVVITCRNPGLSAKAAKQMRDLASCPVDIVDVFSLELDNFASVAEFVKAFGKTGWPLDLLVNNAGMMVTPLLFSEHNPQLEIHTAVNFLGPMLLTELLVPLLKASHGRIVNVASEAHRMPTRYGFTQGRGMALLVLKELNKGKDQCGGALLKGAFLRYGFSKLCNMYYAHYIANVHKIPTCSLHPGVVATGFIDRLVWWWRVFYVVTLLFLKTSRSGSQTTVHCCICPEEEISPMLIEGKTWRFAPYFVDCSNESTVYAHPLAWSVEDAKEVCEWGINGPLSTYIVQ